MRATSATSGPTYQSMRAGLFRYVVAQPGGLERQFEKYARVRYAWTLSGEWPRLAMVMAMYRPGHLPRSGGDRLVAHQGADAGLRRRRGQPGRPGEAFQDRMKFIADSVPNGNGKLHLIPGLGHVPHLEDPGKTYRRSSPS